MNARVPARPRGQRHLLASAGAHRHRRPCRSRQIDPDRTPAGGDRQPARRQARAAQGGERAARHAVRWLSFLLDALQTERDQGITIDTSQIRFRTPSRDFVLIDAPGHTEFLRNMITGASQADAAVLIVDAAEGVREQTRRHGYLLHLLGVRQVVVVINKMDRVSYDDSRFREIDAEISAHLDGFGVKPAAVIPISARHGDGVVARTAAIDWYNGPTVVEALDRFAAGAARDRAAAAPAGAGGLQVRRSPHRGGPHRERDDRGRRRDRGGAVGQARQGALHRSVARRRHRQPARAGERRPLGRHHARPRAVRRARRRHRLGHGQRAGGAAARRPASSGSTTSRSRPAPWSRCGSAPRKRAEPSRRSRIRSIPARWRSTHAETVGQNHVGDIEIALAAPLGRRPLREQPAHRPDRARIWRTHRRRRTGAVAARRGEDGRRAGGRRGACGARRRPRPHAGRPRRRPGASSAFRREVEGPIVFTTSFGLEDQVILHHICEAGLDIDLVTLDTGRLFAETYTTWEETEQRYGRRIRAIYPRHTELEALVAAQGINGFYKSREARAACCDVRKVEPLNRALAGAAGWITGLRADQSAHRGGDRSRRRRSRPRPPQAQPAPRLDPRGGAQLRRHPRGADQSAARERLRLDRLRPLHARDPPRRAGTRRPLVVGRRKQEGVRLARQGGSGALVDSLSRLRGGSGRGLLEGYKPG